MADSTSSDPVITVVHTNDVPADETQLSAAEREALAGLRLGRRLREGWIRGRIAGRRALVALLGPSAAEVSLLIAADDSVCPRGGPPCAVALAHDGDWIAVAAAAGTGQRLGVDLCLRAHTRRLGGILRWLDVRGEGLEPVAQWAALEAALQLRGLSTDALRDRPLEVRRRGEVVEVRGLDAMAAVRLTEAPRFVLAWCAEAT